MYAVYAPFITHVKEAGLLSFVPCFHPWSIHRLDSRALHLDLILTHAKSVLDCTSCTSLYRLIRDQRSLAGEAPAIGPA
jgi:hypothetical protein